MKGGEMTEIKESEHLEKRRKDGTVEKRKEGEGERWELKQREQGRVECCPVPTFLHKHKSFFNLDIHSWAT